MNDKSDARHDGLFTLGARAVVTLAGADATAFAQSQFMSDVTSLGVGDWQWSGWLTPKGRVVALFALARVADDELWLLLPDAAPAPLADGLRRFVFRSKVRVETREVRLAGAFAPSSTARGARLGEGTAGQLELDMSGDGGPRTLVVEPGPAASGAADAPDAAAAWRLADLLHGLPRLADPQLDRWTPQQLSLERLSAFSVRKGCYPGQEIVARTHFLGKAKRGLLLVEGGQPIAEGADLTAGDSVLGPVICSASAGGRHAALVVAPLDRTSEAMSIGGATVSPAPLLGGLARLPGDA